MGGELVVELGEGDDERDDGGLTTSVSPSLEVQNWSCSDGKLS